MVIVIAVASQKGGVGKSTLSRLIAREYANAGWSVKIADLDVGQGTSFNWQGRRLQNDIKPVIPVERFGTVDQALKFTAALDLLVIDAPPHSNAATLKIATTSHLVILPTGLSLDDWSLPRGCGVDLFLATAGDSLFASHGLADGPRLIVPILAIQKRLGILVQVPNVAL